MQNNFQTDSLAIENACRTIFHPEEFSNLPSLIKQLRIQERYSTGGGFNNTKMQVPSKPRLVVETRQEEHYHSKYNSYNNDEEEELDEGDDELEQQQDHAHRFIWEIDHRERMAYYANYQAQDTEEEMAELQLAIESSLQVASFGNQQNKLNKSLNVEEDFVFEVVPQSDSSTTEVADMTSHAGMDDEEEEDWSILLDEEKDNSTSNDDNEDETSSQWTMADMLSQCDQQQPQYSFKHVLMTAMSNFSGSASSNGTIMRRVSPLLASAVRTYSHNSNGGIQSIPEDAELEQTDDLDDMDDCDFEGTFLVAKSGGQDKVAHNTHSHSRGSNNRPPRRNSKAKSKQKGARKNGRRNH